MRLAEIYRHPVKSLGEEALDEVDLNKGKPMPFDRVWGIAHDGAEPISGWAHCGNFVTQRHVPRLAQCNVALTPRNNLLRVTHPDLDDLAVQIGTPDGDDALCEWIAPLTEGTIQSGPFLVYTIPNVAFTDGEEHHVSLASVTSRRALGQLAGLPLEPVRFRMNLWIDGAEPFDELGWIGKRIEIGEVKLEIVSPCERCRAPEASPVTGERDANVTALLREQFGHMDFGVHCQVLSGGTVRRNDAVRLI